jgi:transcriptional regulator with XRE-family HTH domain
MQKARTPEANEVAAAFGRRMKAARADAGLTQAELQELLKERGAPLDTSAITRLEAGRREPRLSEAIAIAATLGFGLTDLAAPTTEIDAYMSEVRQLMEQSRAALLDLLRSVDKATDVLRQVNGEHEG